MRFTLAVSTAGTHRERSAVSKARTSRLSRCHDAAAITGSILPPTFPEAVTHLTATAPAPLNTAALITPLDIPNPEAQSRSTIPEGHGVLHLRDSFTKTPHLEPLADQGESPRRKDAARLLDARPRCSVPEAEVVHYGHSFTKEYDGDSGLVYMYQRWYSGETGTFMSSAPYPAMVEHRYGFAKQRPTVSIDANGRSPFFPVDILPVMPTSPMYQGEGRGVDLLCGRSNPYHRQGQPHQHISWNLGNRGVPYGLLWWGGRGWEAAQGLGALGRGDDFIDLETGRNSDGSPRGSGYQPNDIQLNDEGYNKGDEDRKRENECRERLARRDWA